MKKLCVVNVISDTNIGGAGIVLYNCLKHSDPLRFEHIVILPENSLLRAKLETLNIKITEAAGFADKSLSPGAIKTLKRIFMQLNPDIIHTHASLSARIAAKMRGIPIIYTRHSAFDIPSWRKSLPMRCFQGIINNTFADKIIAVSPAAAENLKDTGADMKKVRIIFNGTDALPPLSEAEKISARERFGICENEFICTILARLTPVKGHEYIIQAAETLKDTRFLIAGTGESEPDLKERAKHLPNVTFLGFVNDPRSLLGVTSVQLNASYGTEATSLSLLEGMSLGIPAIVSDFGGNPFIIETGVNGIVVAKKNAALLAGAIEKLKNDKTLQQTLSNGAKERFSRFTAERMANEVDNLYLSLSSKPR